MRGGGPRRAARNGVCVDDTADDLSASDLAPCVAVVGPANSGKTTLLHRLDRALQEHPARPIACVVKGNPDGTGRYLFEAPEQREALKSRVKGAWRTETVETVRRWIDHARVRIELVLVDFGGKHAPVNADMLARCTHFIVVARAFDDPARERDEGMQSWIDVCEICGLLPLARVISLWKAGEPQVLGTPQGVVEASFRADAVVPDDPRNAAVVARLVDDLVALRRPRQPAGYVDLHLSRRWTPADLVDLAGRAVEVDRAARAGTVALGGVAPTWAYAAALHRALGRVPNLTVDVFDPKVLPGWVRVPAVVAGQASSPLADALDVAWRPAPDGATLDVRLTRPDRFIGLGDEASLAALPLPVGPVPGGRLVVYGAVPVWLRMAYSRWLRGARPDAAIGAWDARLRAAVPVTEPHAGYGVWTWEGPSQDAG